MRDKLMATLNQLAKIHPYGSIVLFSDESGYYQDLNDNIVIDFNTLDEFYAGATKFIKEYEPNKIR